ncbi:MAG: adenosine deaminase [bacterium]
MMQDMAKIELHVHLDGSLRPETVLELAGERKLALPSYDLTALTDCLKAPVNCVSLEDYLQRFRLPLDILQDEESLERCAYELGEDLAREQVIYAEIRYAPLLHIKRNLKPKKVVAAVLRGLERARADYGLHFGVLLCCMRSGDAAVNKDVVRLAGDFYGGGVVGLDLAGDEFHFPVWQQKEVFSFAQGASLPYTIHAGEAAGADSIWAAVKLGASRIGHGVRACEDRELVEFLNKEAIALEMCLTSNLQTKAVTKLAEHPLDRYYRAGLKVTVNTDNRTVSGTDLSKEYALIQEAFHWESHDFAAVNKNALAASFADSDTKARLREIIGN